MDDGVLGSDALLALMEAWGISHVFTCPGSTEAAFLDSVHSFPDVNLFLTTHESTAVAMADGYSRATGRPAVAYLHANVGLANGVSHLYAAQIAHSPVVTFTGLKPVSLQNKRGFTTSQYMRDYVRQHVKIAWQSLAPDAVVEDARRAFKQATCDPKGPVWLGIAQDYLTATIEPPDESPRRFRVDVSTRAVEGEVAQAAELLSGALKPLIIAGAEIPRAGAIDVAVALAERIGATVVGEDRRTFEQTSFPVDHPNFAGMYAVDREVLQEADVVLLAGARNPVQFEPEAWCGLPEHAEIIHLHSDASEHGHTEPVDVPLLGNVRQTLTDLNLALQRHTASDDAAAFLSRAQAERTAKYRDRFSTTHDTQMPWIQVPQLLKALVDCLESNVALISDATTSGGTLLEAASTGSAPEMYSSSSGSLGWGMAAALGFALGDPSRPVAAVVGDGVFQFGVQSLWTAAHYSIPVVFVVINNRSYAAVGAALRRHAGRAYREGLRIGVDISGPDICNIAAGFGVDGVKVDDLSDLGPAVRRAFSASGPSVIEVLTDPEDFGP